MKFIAGLLVGALVTLLVASLATFRWEPPSRLAAVKPGTLGTVTSLEPKPDIETALTPVERVRSVTVDPRPRSAPVAAQQSPVEFATAELALEKVAAPVPVQEALTEAIAASEMGGETPVETAVVWKPFHSEVSANGFARRLSTQLGYPFRALRDGPARYHVVFDYDTEQQRALLQQQVTALTGFEAI